VFGWQPVWYGMEEGELVRRFGEGYKAYRETTPALFPRSLAGELQILKAIVRG
jgi:protein-S-isoprenylcysteine O-methyltransferase Ste14